MTSDNLQLAETQYKAGKDAFERGQYRQSVAALEKAVSLIGRGTPLGGEMQMWLVTAYQAAGQLPEAIALCQSLDAHPDLKTRKQSRRILYILKAPKLQTRPEWLTQIPDLSRLDDPSDNKGASSQRVNRPKASPRPAPLPEPVDLSQVNTKDNSFVWVALGAIALILTSLFWFSNS